MARMLNLIVLMSVLVAGCQKLGIPDNIPHKVDLLPMNATNFTASATGVGQIHLRWTAGEGTTGYRLALKKGTVSPLDCDWGTDLGNVTVYEVNHLEPGSEYSFLLCSYNGKDKPDLSSGVSLTTATAFAPPANVSSFTAIGVSATQLSLAWSSPGPTVVGFKLAYQTSTPPANCDGGIDLGNVFTYTLSGLSPTTNYQLLLCAYNQTNLISTGTAASAATLQAPPPNAAALAASQQTATGFKVTWTAAGGTRAGYKIAYQAGTTAPANCASAVDILDVTSKVMTGLTAGTSYSIRLCSYNGNPTPDLSNGVTLTTKTLQLPPPDATALQATASSKSDISLSWKAAGGSAKGYRLAFLPGTVAPTNCSTGIDVMNVTSYVASGLNNHTAYTFRLCSYNGNPTPDLSAGALVSATTWDVPPMDPTNLVAVQVQVSQIRLTWTPASGSAVGYRLAYQVGTTPPVNCAGGNDLGNVSNYILTNLVPNSRYSFRLCSYNSNPNPESSGGATVSALLGVAITNLHQGDVIESGFLVGESGINGQVGCQLDNLSIELISANPRWSCGFPNGTHTWRMGSSHTLKVGLTVGGAFSGPTVTITATKGKNKDLNGDGYADLVVGAPGKDSFGQTSISIFQGGPKGISTTPSQVLRSSITIGMAMALGDVNGDGYADLVTRSGDGLRIYLGNNLGLLANPTYTIPPPALGFYNSVATADGNYDGFDDVVVGAAGATGGFYVFAGTPSSFPMTPTQSFVGPAGFSTGSQFGLGDVNGDRYLDLVIVEGPQSASGNGMLFIFHGGPGGFPSSPSTTVTYSSSGYYYGTYGGISVADYDGDGRADVAVSYVPQNAALTGSVLVYRGAASGLESIPHKINGIVSKTIFSAGLESRDINGDGYADLFVGSSSFDAATTSAVYLYKGAAAGLPTSPDATVSDPFGPGITAFGALLTVADLNGDGSADLIASSVVGGHGPVYVFPGLSTSAAIATVPSVTLLPSTASDRFGAFMAR